jgi:hypothetical protein
MGWGGGQWRLGRGRGRTVAAGWLRRIISHSKHGSPTCNKLKG